VKKYGAEEQHQKKVARRCLSPLIEKYNQVERLKTYQKK
jgi:hypothetical protein